MDALDIPKATSSFASESINLLIDSFEPEAVIVIGIDDPPLI